MRESSQDAERRIGLNTCTEKFQYVWWINFSSFRDGEHSLNFFLVLYALPSYTLQVYKLMTDQERWKSGKKEERKSHKTTSTRQL